MSRTFLLFSSNLSSHWHLLMGLSPFPSVLRSVLYAKINSWNPTSSCFLMFCTVTIVWDIVHILFLIKLIKPVFLAFAPLFYWMEYLLFVPLTPAQTYTSEGSYIWNLPVLSKIRNIPSLSHKATFLFIYLTVYIASYFQNIVLLVTCVS